VQELRKLWRQLQKQWDSSKLVFIDECGINTKMVRLYGRSASSERCVDHAPHGHWHTNTFIAGLRNDRIEATVLFDGPMNAATFLEYVQSVLIPTLKEGDLVICDNLSCHKSPAVREALQAIGADIKYLPPYSPDMNPIEMAFSKIKAFLKACRCESFQEIVRKLGKALDSFDQTICNNLFRHAQYVSI
jgi:transposase